MKKTRIILALLMAVLALWAVFPAMADEAPGSMDVSPGDDEPPEVSDPEPPVVSDPEPPVTEPPVEPTDDPGPTDEPTTDPEPTDEPSAEPSEEPTPEPVVDNNGGGTDQGTTTRPSVNVGGGIRQPSTSSRRPSSGTGSVSPESSGSSGSTQQAPLDDGPQYVTFARVTQKSNSMSRTLFYSGAACVGAGVLGLVVLVVFIIRGRHVDDREEIFAEIEQAAVRQPVPSRQPRQARRQAVYEDDPYAQYDRTGQDGYEEDYGGQNYQQPYDPRYAQGYDSPAPSLHRPEPEELAVPVNGGLYTEEFELPPQQRGYRSEDPVVPAQASMYTEEFEPPRPVAPPARGAVRPQQAYMYTEEFELPDEMAQPPAPPVQRYQVQQAPVQAPRRVQRQSPQPRPSSQVPPEQMDTTELLREILYGEDDK